MVVSDSTGTATFSASVPRRSTPTSLRSSSARSPSVQLVRVFADVDDVADPVATEDVRERRPGGVLSLGEIPVSRIERGVVDAQDDFAFAGPRIGSFTEPQSIQTAESFKQPCFHARLLPPFASGLAVSGSSGHECLGYRTRRSLRTWKYVVFQKL